MTPLSAGMIGILTVVLALAPPVWLALAPPRGAAVTSLRVALAVAFEVVVLRVGAWPSTSVYLRGVAAGALVVGALVGLARTVRAGSKGRASVAVHVALLVPVVALDVSALSASRYEEVPLEAHLPLAPGTYAVLFGGNSKLTNPFHGKARELAAIDLVKLTPWGSKATGLASRALTDYASFGAPVTSVCDGEVVAAESALPDDEVGVPDEEHPAGNHVVVRCAGGLVKVAHLMHASVVVRVGARVVTGQRLGSIGNSGATSEPHLHIGAFPLGARMDVVLDHSGDMPVRLDGRFLVANDVFTVE